MSLEDESQEKPHSWRLEPGESLLWEGRPRQGVVFYTADWFLIPFSIVWTAIVVFALARAWAKGENILLIPVSGILLVVAFLALIGRFLIDCFNRSSLYYAVTSKRILIDRDFETDSIALAYLPALVLNRNSNGVGTIIFNFDERRRMLFELMGGAANRPFSSRYEPLQFVLIENVADVCAEIKRARAAVVQSENGTKHP